MKDHYDAWMLTSAFEPEREAPALAHRGNLRSPRHRDPFDHPDGLSDRLAEDPGKRSSGRRLRGTSRPVPEFSTMVAQLRDRLAPYLAPT